MAAYILALINNHEDGKRFFETYNIPYQIITRGENKGKLRVKATRYSDGQAEYYGAAEPSVRCGESHLSGLTEPPIDSYSA